MPLPRGTKKTDAKRRADNKYSAKTYKVAACKIKIADYEAFERYAKSLGENETVSSVLTAYIKSCIEKEVS